MADGMKSTIAQAYLSLLEEGGDQVISVTDVVDRAEISRMTFYYHFHDIYDLFDWLYGSYFQHELDLALAENSGRKRTEAWRDVLVRIVRIISDNELHVLDNYRHLDPYILDRHAFAIFHRMVEQAFEVMLKPGALDETDQHTVVEVCTFTLIGMLKTWMDRDLDFDPIDYIDAVDRFIKNNTRPFARKR